MKGSFSKDQYYRINPVLQENIPIDEKNKTVLNNLKKIGEQYFVDWEQKDKASLNKLIKMLRGDTRN